ncbi:glutaminyl-peptide cyclotransferase [Polaribacter sp. Z014]|uniref:glutaminyl-peptide cyclotransferase n=1 Tax=Polaribacter sp. Z014 TaxID=2927126 RepID=UPI0020205ED8|nr:glutaminyl-peptide cyclotransferase [Polaribacter sp. Z014]MCL7763305.1 glutaminyl-peptide cyclotransferase [Polaribacter sp. Z014]
MKNSTLLVAFLACFLLITSCSDVYKFSLNHKKQVTLNSNLEVTLKEKEDKPVTNVQFFVNGKEVSSEGNTVSINTTNLGVGKHKISALIFYAEKTKKENSFFEVLADKTPIVYDYKIINEYPHDKTAYTQGLEYHDGFLYESTGRRGQSNLRKVEIKTGKVLQKIDLDKKYFGEGMTIFNNKIYWLTWQGKKGFVYNLETFKQEKEFAYNNSAEGWGFTHNGTQLIKSDGTSKIWFLDPDTLKELKSIQVYTNKYAVDNLNELELINGKIYANKYQQNAIVIIDPKTGVVEGIANLKGLHAEMEKTQKLVPQDEVLNGIAFDAENNRLFVTGKHWGKLFEIELIKKQ